MGSNAPNLPGRQNPKVLTNRLMFQAFGNFIKVFEVTGITSAHRHGYRKLHCRFPGPIVE